MEYVIYIDSFEVEKKYVDSVAVTETNLSFDGAKLISSKITIKLINDDYLFDDRQNTNGIFYDVDWYDSTVSIYNSDETVKIAEGRLKKLTIDDKSRLTTLIVNDYVQDMVDTNCVIVETGITVAEAIYTILTNPDYLNIQDERITYTSIERAITLQQDKLIDINIQLQDNLKCISVLEELCRMSNGHIYIENNSIQYWIWYRYFGALGVSINDNDYLPSTYNHYTDDSKILNQYSIAWKDGATAQFAEGSSSTSIAKYGGGKVFSVPDKSIGTSVASYKIIYATEEGAHAVGASILDRYSELRKICKLEVGDHLDFVMLGDTLDLRFEPYTREPVLLTNYKPDFKKHTISLECELLNYPTFIPIDVTPPSGVELLLCEAFEDSIIIQWSKSFEEDHLGYLVYFSTSPGEFNLELSSAGPSPIDVKNPSMSFDGNCYFTFSVSNYTTYYVKVVSYDTSYNRSVDSNILSCTLYDSPVSLNAYMCKGNLYAGIILDVSNSLGGYLPTGFTHYDEINYDEGTYELTAVYQSEILYRPNGIESVSLQSQVSSAGNISVQFRVYSSGSLSDWSEESPVNGSLLLDTEGNFYIQLRFLFYSPNWTDPDTIMVTGIQEVA